MLAIMFCRPIQHPVEYVSEYHLLNYIRHQYN